MDMIEMRFRMMAMIGGNMTIHKHGTFTGDQTNSVTLPIGFAPDVLVIHADVDYYTSGWVGVGAVFVSKGMFSAVIRHNNTTAALAASNAYGFKQNDGDYGISQNAAQYTFYGTYTDGNLTLTNSANSAGTQFINNMEYTWDAYKA